MPAGSKPTKRERFSVVVVDDSPTMRKWLNSIIEQDERLQIVGLAGSAEEARTVIKATNPDVLTLDVEMPGIDGLEFLSHLMRLRPMPVVMLASAIRSESPYARRAMDLGAVACIAKPQMPNQASVQALRDAIFNAAAGVMPDRADRVPLNSQFADRIFLIGASTGGVTAIEALLATLPRDIPPIVIAQHMPQSFLTSFVQRLDRLAAHSVEFARSGLRLNPGTIYICPSEDKQTCVAWHSEAWHIQCVPRSWDHAYCPSVDVLFASGVPWADRVGAAILTGLGSDGAHGMLALRRNGARTIGQSREGCTVYGMPCAARSMNAVEEEVDIQQIAPNMLARLGRRGRTAVSP